jgi:tryptophan-rich sensory protein
MSLKYHTKAASSLKWYQILSIIAAVCLPASIFYIGGVLWPTSSQAGQNVKFRPPSKSFMWIWIGVIALVTMAWIVISASVANKQFLGWTNVVFLGFIALAITWQYTFKKIGTKEALWVLLAMLIVNMWLLVLANKANCVAAILLVPVAVWVLFAVLMNAADVQEHKTVVE